MRADDQLELIEAAEVITTSAIKLTEVSDAVVSAVNDNVGLRARIQRARDRLVQVQELVDGAMDRLDVAIANVATCRHPEEFYKRLDEVTYVCTGCGAVWSGLRWSSHVDDPASAG